MTGYAGSRDYAGNPQSPWRTPQRSTHPTEKQILTLSLRVLCTEQSQREGRSLQREGRSLQRECRRPVFQLDVWIDVGSSTGTAGSLCNPETRRTPSYVRRYLIYRSHIKFHPIKGVFSVSIYILPVEVVGTVRNILCKFDFFVNSPFKGRRQKLKWPISGQR